VLSPLLFSIVLEALSMVFTEGLPWQLLYADDLALLAESKEIQLFLAVVKAKDQALEIRTRRKGS